MLVLLSVVFFPVNQAGDFAQERGFFARGGVKAYPPFWLIARHD
jgi:hypothetical protein